MQMFRFLLILALAFPLTAKAEPTCECTQPRSSDFHTTACPTISSTPADDSKHVGRMWFQAIVIKTLMQLIAEYNGLKISFDDEYILVSD